MTLLVTDLGLMLTVLAGTSGSSQPQGDPTASRGRYASTTALASGLAGAIFSEVTAAQAGAGLTDFRCLAVRNLSTTATARNVAAYLVDPAGGGTFAIGRDPVGIVAHNSAAVQGTEIATVTTVPTGITFAAHPAGSPLAIGDMAPNTVQLVWVRRVVGADTPGTAADTVTIGVRAETA